MHTERIEKKCFPVSKVSQVFPQKGLSVRKYKEGKEKGFFLVSFEDSSLKELYFSDISFKEEAIPSERKKIEVLREKIEQTLTILSEYLENEVVSEVISETIRLFPEISFAFLKSHHYLLDSVVSKDSRKAILRFDLDIVEETGESGENLPFLYALGVFCQFCYLKGEGEKESLLKVLSFYEILEKKDQNRILEVLSLPKLDSGKVFSSFLKEAAYKTLPEKEKMVAWLRARELFPLPYNREAVKEVIKEEKDLSSLRTRIYQTIKNSYLEEFDTETANQVADKCLEEGKRLVCGRFSRAFYIDALLLANAKVLSSSSLKKEILNLEKMVKEERFSFKNEELISEEINFDPIQAELQAIVNLLTQKEISLAEIEGKIEKFREAIRHFESSFLTKFDDFQKKKSDLIAGQIKEKGKSKIWQDISLDRRNFREKIEEIRQVIGELEWALARIPKKDPAIIVFFQRLFEIDAINMGILNELKDPFFGEDEEIHSLIRGGGHNIYVTPNMKGWLRKCDDWIEALPAYASYQIVPENGGYKFRAWVQRSILKQIYTGHAEDWVLNIEEVMDLEYVALAREIVARENHLQEKARQVSKEESPEERIRKIINERGLFSEVAAVAAIVERVYFDFCEDVARLAEREEISRFLALKRIIEEKKNLVNELLGEKKKKGCSLKVALTEFLKKHSLQKRAERFLPLSQKRRRRLPSIHVLTTLGPGESEFNVKNWLEEAMLLINVCRAYNLEKKVAQRIKMWQASIVNLGEKVVSELNLEGKLYEIMEGGERKEAILKLIASYPEVKREVAKLTLLLEEEDKNLEFLDKVSEPKRVLDYISLHPELEKEIARKVVQNNNLEEELKNEAETKSISEEEAIESFIEKNLHLKEEKEVMLLSEAREKVIKELGLKEKAKEFLEDFLDPTLAKIKARRELIAEKGLLEEVNNPRFRYEAEGPCKKYNLLYTPSRVDLGAKEVSSVKNVPKWVGGMDDEAVNSGKLLYGLYNVAGPTLIASTRAAEFLKVGENFFSRGGVYYLSLTAGINLDALHIGDFEFFRDQWNMRGDRIVLPSGETYGGFCVPKEFSLLYAIIIASVEKKTSREMLSSFGIPEKIYPEIIKDLRRVLSWQIDFENQLDWELKAASYLTQRYPYYFKVLGEPFYISRLPQLAKTLEKMGILSSQKEEEKERELSFRFAYWVNKKAQGLEEINRTGPFRKVHLIYQLIKEAQAKRKDILPAEKLIGVMSASYKEGEEKDSQEIPISDVRFSAGARKLEIYAKVAENHILLDIDPEGRQIIKEMFKGFVPPVDIRIIGSCTGSDILNHIPNSGLEEIKERVLERLKEAGLDETLIQTNCLVYGGDLENWVGIREKSSSEKEKLIEELKGRIHLLVIDKRGPFRRHQEAVQGVDFIDLGIPDPELLDLIENLPKLIYLMKRGRAGSALVFADGTSGARRPTFAFRYPSAKRKVKELFALEERAVYGCLGIGKDTIVKWQEEMVKDREEAKALLDNLLFNNFKEAERIYKRIKERIRRERRAEEAILDEVRAKKLGVFSREDRYISSAYSKLIRGLSLSDLDFGTWILLGGVYSLNGKFEKKDVGSLREKFKRAIKKIPSLGEREISGFSKEEIDFILEHFLKTPYHPPKEGLYREISTGLAGSLKVVEEKVSRLQRWAARRKETDRILALKKREKAFLAFEENISSFAKDNFSSLCELAKKRVGEGKGKISQKYLGEFLAISGEALRLLCSRIVSLGAKEKGNLLDKFFSGGEVLPEDYLELCQYITKNASFKNDDKTFLEEVAMGLELLDIALLLEKTIDVKEPEEMMIEIARFFDITINSHIFDYLPYHYHKERGSALEELSRKEKISLAERHHRWLYTRIRCLLANKTSMAKMGRDYQNEWLGDADRHLLGLGVRGNNSEEKFWFSYARLRDVSVLRHEGYPFPEIFTDVDPDLISDKERANVAVVYPVGNTTIPVALEQGPHLAKNNKINLILSSFPEIKEKNGEKLLYLDEGFIFLGKEDYEKVRENSTLLGLERHSSKGKTEVCSALEGKKGSSELTIRGKMNQGTLCGLAFKEPLLAHGVFFHFTHPLRCEIDKLKIPLIQPLIWESATHLKCELPAMLKGSGVRTAEQRNWYLEDTERLSEREAKVKIEEKILELSQKCSTLIIKPEKESGGRKAKILPVKEEGRLINENIVVLRNLIYEISQTDNVVIQEVLNSYVRRLYTPEFLRNMVDRFARIGVPVLLERDPQTPLFSYFREILVLGKDEYKISHHITVISTQGIANVGQGGLLYEYTDDIINPKYREDLRREITRAAYSSLEAQRNYLKYNWKKVLKEYLKVYPEFFRKVKIERIKKDLTGFAQNDIPYEMADFMPVFLVDEDDNLTSIFDEKREELLPLFDEKGEPTEVQIFDKEGKPIPRKDKKGRVLPIPMFDNEGKRILRYDKKGRPVGTLVVYKIEANPGAGLWRPHNDQLPEERKGEGVSIIFRSLGERARIYKSAIEQGL